MIKINFIRFFIIFILLTSCSKETEKVLNIKETSQNLEMVNIYNEAYESLNNNDPYIAAKKFLEAELLFPQSIWAPRSALMASYSFYLQITARIII